MHSSVGLALLCFFIISMVQAAENTTAFYAEGRSIVVKVDNKGPFVFKMRGFSYSNSRIGEGAPTDDNSAGWDSLQRPQICEQDFGLMRKLNVNALKFYAFNVVNNIPHKPCLDIAWNQGHKPIFLVLSIWITTLPFPDAGTKANMIDRYVKMVNTTKEYPAVMGYSIGSEISGDPNNNPAYWQDFNDIAHAIHKELGPIKKIVTTGTYQTNNNVPNVPVLGHVINGEKYGAAVDVWGVDIYSPNPNEPNLRKDIWTYTKKPFFLPEYGVNFQPPQDPQERSKALLEMVSEMEQYSYSETKNGNQGPDYDPNGPIYSGGLVFEWIDEYWKAPDGSNCKPNPASAQAYYGTNAISLKSGCTCVPPEQRTPECYLDERNPRDIFNLLPSLWSAYEPKELN